MTRNRILCAVAGSDAKSRSRCVFGARRPLPAGPRRIRFQGRIQRASECGLSRRHVRPLELREPAEQRGDTMAAPVLKSGYGSREGMSVTVNAVAVFKTRNPAVDARKAAGLRLLGRRTARRKRDRKSSCGTRRTAYGAPVIRSAGTGAEHRGGRRRPARRRSPGGNPGPGQESPAVIMTRACAAPAGQ